MTATSERFSKIRSARPAIAAPDADTPENLILLALPRAELDIAISKMEFIQINNREVLVESGESIAYGYFVTSGLASILNVMSDGKSVEVGLTGREGFVGLPLLVGFNFSPAQAIMQIPGSAYRIKAADVEPMLRSCPELERLLNRYSQEFSLQSMQLAACNQLHEVAARLARWLLMSQDRVSGTTLHMTQESLANMLGTRRASVTVAAGILQNAKLITYSGGIVEIEDRQGLENAACECYKVLNDRIEAWRNGSHQNAT